MKNRTAAPPRPRGPRAGALGTALRIAVLALAAPGAGCGGDGARAADTTAVALASIDARLRGTFRLVSFVPETPLDPVMAALLNEQYARLVIRFDGRRLTADSPGIHVDRAYEIRDPQGDRFKIIAYDETGVPYESVCELSGTGELVVYATTPPWRGVATLRRNAP